MLSINFHTHSIDLIEDGDFTKAVISLKNEITNDWYDTILNSQYASSYVEGERILFSNFCKSLVSFHNSFSLEKFLFNRFGSEGEYYIFCVNNNLEFEDNLWFRVIYVHAKLLYAYALLHNLSVRFVSTLHPELIYYPSNHPDLAFRENTDAKHFRSDSFHIQNIFSKHNITRLYHTTSSQNLSSIKQMQGLYSIQYLREHNITPHYASSRMSRSIDAEKGFANYVHLSYEPDYPMIKSALNRGILSGCKTFIVDTIVALMTGSAFSEKNMITTTIMPSTDSSVLDKIPFANFHGKPYWSLSDEDKKSYMAEVLIPKTVSSNYILNWNEL